MIVVRGQRETYIYVRRYIEISVFIFVCVYVNRDHRGPLTKVLGVSIDLGDYEFKKCILPYHKSTLDAYRRVYEYLMDIMYGVTFTMYS